MCPGAVIRGVVGVEGSMGMLQGDMQQLLQ